MVRNRVYVLVSGTVILLAMVVAGVVYAATGYDLTVAGAGVTINGARFESLTPADPAHGKIFNPIVRLDSPNPVIRGYNTDYRPTEFDEVQSPSYTKSILLSEVPQIIRDGTLYREFLVDINQHTNADNFLLTVDNIELYESAYPDLCGYPFDGSGGGHSGCTNGNIARLIYDMGALEDSFAVLDYRNNAGNGKLDLRVLVPNSLFNLDPNCTCGGAGCLVYITVHMEFGGDYEPGSPDPTLQVPHENNDGFEQAGVAFHELIDLDITITGAHTVTLSWTGGSGPYSVMRSTKPYSDFAPLATNLPYTSYDDGAAAGDPGTNHFYYVTSVCAASNVVGEFDFGVVPGS